MGKTAMRRPDGPVRAVRLTNVLSSPPSAQPATQPPASSNQILGPKNRDLVDAYIRGAPAGAIPLRELTIDLTMACNCRCVGCVEDHAMCAARRAALSTQGVLRRADALPGLGVRLVKLYGGEPTLHAGFARIVRALVDRDIQVYLSTNGILLHKFIDELAAAKEHVRVRISLNAGSEPTHCRIFRPADGRSHFHQVLQNAAALSRNGVGVSFSVVVRPEVVRELPAAAKYARDAGAEALTLKPLIDSTSKHLCLLDRTLRAAVRAEIVGVRATQTPTFRVHVSETLQAVLIATAPSDLVQPKLFRTCPYTMFRAVVSPPEPGTVSTCPYHRCSPDHTLLGVATGLGRNWLGSAERVAVIARPDARKHCSFYCDRGDMANWLWAMRQRYEREGEGVLREIPIVQENRGPFV